MEYSPVFLRARAIVFASVAFISFAWTVLLSVVLTLQWDMMDKPERSFVAVMIVLDVITMFLLLILLVLRFRPWLDSARCFFLLVSHIATAAWFLSWSPKFHCENGNLDQEGTCGLLIVYMAIASWLIPVLVLCYLGGLALMLYRRSKLQKATGSISIENDVEKWSSGSLSRSHDSFFPSNSQHSSQSFESKRLTIPPPTMGQNRMTQGRMFDGSSRDSFSMARQSYGMRSSVPLRTSQSPIGVLPKVNEVFNTSSDNSWMRQSRLTLSSSSVRTSQGPPSARQSPILTKSARGIQNMY
ncbi:hypothetical protein L218DRAFT_957970 [Marasmius fiardii PR-910]|nr:hypothetical protein L218DRAFT_957970 [Marasmius fiardii PR-910]